jgi:hypothetical protein
MMNDPATPPIRDSGATGVPEREQRDPTNSEGQERGKEPLVNKIADRNAEGPREAGTTPRPTDKPIVGGDRGSAA